jgi:hypothetical protein
VGQAGLANDDLDAIAGAFHANTESAVMRTVSVCPRVNSSWQRVSAEATFPSKSILLAVEPLPNEVVAFRLDGVFVKWIARSPGETWMGKSWQPLALKTGLAFTGFRPIEVSPSSVLKIETFRSSAERVLVLYLAAKGRTYSFDWSLSDAGSAWSEFPDAAICRWRTC